MRIAPEMSVREAVAAMLARHNGNLSALHPFWTASRAGQQERYERILVTAIELARTQGYDAMQMRNVAQRSNVALATVYTYFQSRDHLIHRASVAWNSVLTEAAAEHAHTTRASDESGRSPFLTFITALTGMFVAQPKVLEVWVRSTMTRDKSVTSTQANIDWLHWARAFDHDVSPGSDLEHHMFVIGDVFYAGAVRWAFGQAELDQVIDRTLGVTERLLGAPNSVDG
ncbi:TetR/AcrR family transcriptional regulator [Streptomyces sp. NPDC057363]|uniref:TetR/AcrR family transcriptional regulator n=1 Tax=Streptomyces sp. NPDC057363 TaxID=3346107 RepID=UPI00363FE5B5